VSLFGYNSPGFLTIYFRNNLFMPKRSVVATAAAGWFARLQVISVRSGRASAFSDDTRGTIAVIVALLLLPMLALTSFALEQVQVSSFRQTLQTVADRGAQAGAAFDDDLSEPRRREETIAQVTKLLIVAQLKPAEVKTKADFARPNADDGVVATVSLEAVAPSVFTLLPARVHRVRVVATSGSAQSAMSEHLVRCHVVSTQSEYESLGC
jgi:Flp pilus assembly protein TadG